MRGKKARDQPPLKAVLKRVKLLRPSLTNLHLVVQNSTSRVAAAREIDRQDNITNKHSYLNQLSRNLSRVPLNGTQFKMRKTHSMLEPSKLNLNLILQSTVVWRSWTKSTFTIISSERETKLSINWKESPSRPRDSRDLQRQMKCPQNN